MKKYDKSIFMMNGEELYNFFVDLDTVFRRFKNTNCQVFSAKNNYHYITYALLELYSACSDTFIKDLILSHQELIYNLYDAFVRLQSYKCKGYYIRIMWLLYNDYGSERYKSQYWEPKYRIDHFVNLLNNKEKEL